MRYWGYFIGKLAVAAGVMYGAWLLMLAMLPEPVVFMKVRMGGAAQDLTWTFAYLFYWLGCTAILFLVVWDQRRRCRTCLRKLRMPVHSGNWGLALLFAPPKTESICPYGHGTLVSPDTHTSTAQPTNWAEHGDMWEELEQYDSHSRR